MGLALAKITSTTTSTPAHHHVPAIVQRRVPESIAIMTKTKSDRGTTTPMASFCTRARTLAGTLARRFRLPRPPEPERNTRCPNDTTSEPAAVATEPKPRAS